ncbi:succinate dehydrogenase, hydrophobic membrane anchor protein [Achromobacter sp. Marseille-Q4962]|uniref:succinate dehydrogenase, hydrophobic membrane anchor protein n=1 Tax=Achromobacter sp. Marseille-Q4962 TaxID=2942202 RepID=UPI00207430B2|nr:succinate dehydrogenase, hydrophobic membrane anchor protein [Achromobacter sp. Marseille-Q4962]
MRQFTGQRAWLMQRLSALALLAAAAALAGFLLAAGPPDYHTWAAFARHPLGGTLILAVAAALCLHGWVGARDVALDYIHRPWLRLAVLALAASALGLVFLRVLLALARVF